MGSLSQDAVKEVAIPLPSTRTQNKIVDEFDKRTERAKKLQDEAIEGLDQAKKQVEEIILSGN